MTSTPGRRPGTVPERGPHARSRTAPPPAVRVAAALGAAALLVGLTWLVVGDTAAHVSDGDLDGGSPELRAALHQALAAEESYAVEHDGGYTQSLRELFRYEEAPSADVEIRIVHADESAGGEDGYCLSAQHVDGGPVLWFSTETGEITDTPCG